MKRFLYVTLFLIVIIGGIFLIFGRKNNTLNEKGAGGFKDFFSRSITPENTTTNDTSLLDEALVLPQLSPTSPFTPMSLFPVAGYTVFKNTKTITNLDSMNNPTKTTIVDVVTRFVSRANGYVYETIGGETALQISNIFIPNIYEALFSKNGSNAIVRFLRDDGKTVATYSFPIPETNPDGTRTQIPGIYLPDNITAITTNPNQEQITFIQKTENGVVLKNSGFDYKKQKILLQHDFESWLPLVTNKQTYLQTKASGLVDGFLYLLNEKSVVLKKILGNTSGLTVTISPQGNLVLFSKSTKNGFTTNIYSTKDGSVIPSFVPVIPEKCVWLENEDLICAKSTTLENALYPDEWYAGTISFNDSFIKIYTKSGSYETLLDTPPFSFDATNLTVDETNGMLYFMDKKTGILWRFNYR